FACVTLLPFQAITKEPAERAPIWLLESDTANVILAGSVHLLREKDLPIPAPFDEAYEIADRLVFELDMNEMNSPATAMAVRQQGVLPEGESLEDYFDAETLKAIKVYAGDLGLPRAVVEQMRPGTLFVTLTSLAAMRHGARPDLGIEIQYFKKAVKDEKPTSGLETMQYQMGIFHEISIETLTRLFQEMIEEVDESEESLDDIIAAWKSGDPKQIEEIIVAELAEEEEVKRLLLDDRNQNWIPVIEEALKGNETVMFIVGAAHLAGEGSVIDLLQKKGYEPYQMTPALQIP
ncbi:MAG: TraB/GumN family protein, partial [Verrucomicrobiota bacterium]